MITTRSANFALFVGGVARPGGGAPAVRGVGQRRRAAARPGAVAKTLSMDMRANDRPGCSSSSMRWPPWPRARPSRCPSRRTARSACSPAWWRPPQVIRWRCEQLGAPVGQGAHAGDGRDVQPRRAAHRHRRHAGLDGGRGQPGHRREFTLTLKEVTLPCPTAAGDAPCVVGFSGNYPRALDGLARLLSLDMRVIDPAWIGMKLAQAAQLRRAAGRFHGLRARAAGERRQLPRRRWPTSRGSSSTATRCWACSTSRASAARDGHPRVAQGRGNGGDRRRCRPAAVPRVRQPTVIHKDGCDFCTACGYAGSVGEAGRGSVPAHWIHACRTA